MRLIYLFLRVFSSFRRLLGHRLGRLGVLSAGSAADFLNDVSEFAGINIQPGRLEGWTFRIDADGSRLYQTDRQRVWCETISSRRSIVTDRTLRKFSHGVYVCATGLKKSSLV